MADSMTVEQLIDQLVDRAREYEAAVRFGDVNMHAAAKYRLELAKAEAIDAQTQSGVR